MGDKLPSDQVLEESPDLALLPDLPGGDKAATNHSGLDANQSIDFTGIKKFVFFVGSVEF